MARPSAGLVGSFRHLDSLLEAIEQLRQAGHRNLRTLSPVPHHAIDEALEKPPSPVRYFTLVGCLLGGATGLVLTIATALHYPLITGGKPIISIPPFLIIVFELTILFGGLLTLGGMLLNARLPRVHLLPAYDPRFIALSTPQGPIDALAFVINHEAENYLHELSLEETARCIGTGVGVFGRNIDYLENIVAHLAAFDIEDKETLELHRLARQIAGVTGGADSGAS